MTVKRRFEVHEGVNEVVVSAPTHDSLVTVSKDKAFETTDAFIAMALEAHPQVKETTEGGTAAVGAKASKDAAKKAVADAEASRTGLGGDDA